MTTGTVPGLRARASAGLVEAVAVVGETEAGEEKEAEEAAKIVEADTSMEIRFKMV